MTEWLWSVTLDAEGQPQAHRQPAFAWRTGRDPGAIADRWSPINETAFDEFAKEIATQPQKWTVRDGDPALRKLLNIQESKESLNVFTFYGQPWPDVLKVCVLGFRGDVLASLL